MEKIVREVVENYVSGVTKPDIELLRSAFRSDAHMWGYLGPTPVTIPIEVFFDIVAKAPDPAGWVSGYASIIRSIEVTGDVAVAVLEETGYLGGNFTNYFSLMRENGTWAIASKTFFLTGGDAPPVL
jgi:Putative lumazine-binding